MYEELNLSEIKAKGWIKNYLKTQAKGMTGNMDKIGVPFSLQCWEQKGNPLREAGFLGGINSNDDSWTPFEQNGYWIDGMIRTGRLIDDDSLIALAGSKIYPAIEQADEDGFIGPSFLRENLSWQHAVYFRALTAEYTATGDRRILKALKKHYLRRPLKEVYKFSDWRIIAVRNVADIETALWLYGQTQDEYFLKEAEESYEEFNHRFSDDSEADVNSKMYDVTLQGMLDNRKVNKNHGVTYCELCKLGAILYKYTGKEIYKKASVKAFDKLYRDQMLIDGVHSSSEYLNGNGNSHAMHETCDVSDLTWALGYLFMVTGDSKYGDWVENAVFNAGLSSVDDDFKGNQYFSCPNQVVCNDHSNHLVFFRGRDWNSYAPKQLLACCAGNVHRFMPNYVARSWMKDGNRLAVFTYAPSEIETTLLNGKVKISEETMYPFENTVRFTVHISKNTAFELVLRKPVWAVSAELYVNGTKQKNAFKDNVFVLKRTFSDGDEIRLVFTDKVEFIENAKGVSVKKGCLLYALPIKERVVVEGLRDLGNEEFPHYSLYPESKWNYGIAKDSENRFVVNGVFGEEPWRASNNPYTIELKGYDIPKWQLKRLKKYKTRFKPREKCHWEDGEAWILPKVGAVTPLQVGREETITLVPYCTTRLRIAIFPKVHG